MAATPTEPGRIRLGTQGWNYAAWVGAFYPARTRAADFLGVYGRAFDTVEVDSTFYAIPPSSTVRGWVERTPAGFTFALKLPREVTHERRLRGSEDVEAEFFERARELGDRLGPVLVQFGPDFGPGELGALERFVGRLPGDVQIAVELRQHAWVQRGVLEPVLALLRAHGVALALSDGRWMPRRIVLELAARPTAAFHYVRWMGPDRALTDFSHIQVDRSAVLDTWAQALAPLPARGLTLYGYASNHFAGHSPATARELQQRLGQTPTEPDSLAEQTSLF